MSSTEIHCETQAVVKEKMKSKFSRRRSNPFSVHAISYCNLRYQMHSFCFLRLSVLNTQILVFVGVENAVKLVSPPLPFSFPSNNVVIWYYACVKFQHIFMTESRSQGWKTLGKRLSYDLHQRFVHALLSAVFLFRSHWEGNFYEIKFSVNILATPVVFC